MKILITGAEGMLGSDLVKSLEQTDASIIAASKKDLDVIDYNACDKFIKNNNPNLIINCAAYTDVDGAEDNLPEAYKINRTGAKNLAYSANKNNSKILYVSTDYVFDGEKGSAYIENDKPQPAGYYGFSKYLGEVSTTYNCEQSYIVRTSSLYGKKGNNFVDTILNSDKENLKVVNDQTSSPTSTKALSEGIIKLIYGEYPFGIYHLACEGQCTWFDLATFSDKLTKSNKKIEPCRTSEFPTKARRPKLSVLKSTKLDFKLPHWKEALEDYLS